MRRTAPLGIGHTTPDIGRKTFGRIRPYTPEYINSIESIYNGHTSSE